MEKVAECLLILLINLLKLISLTKYIQFDIHNVASKVCIHTKRIIYIIFIYNNLIGNSYPSVKLLIRVNETKCNDLGEGKRKTCFDIS